MSARSLLQPLLPTCLANASSQWTSQDPHNPDLRAHVLRGDIMPDAFVRMTATELANKVLKEALSCWPAAGPCVGMAMTLIC